LDDSLDPNELIDLNADATYVKSHAIATSENREKIMQHWVVGETRDNFCFVVHFAPTTSTTIVLSELLPVAEVMKKEKQSKEDIVRFLHNKAQVLNYICFDNERRC
jgi:hypothetical protein